MKQSQRLNVKEVYEALIQQFDNEIAILIDTPLPSVKDYQPHLAEILERFREDAIDFEFVGRGGWYGKIKI
jgi:PHP family Zn ribbon phosphoesterase